MNLPARGRAAGKVIVLGEHAVVYGRPALAAGLGCGLVVEVSRTPGALRCVSDRPELARDPRPAALVAEAATALGVPADGLCVCIRSELPPGAGLGSSAALAVAVLRALAAAAERTLDDADVLTLARRLEAIFHGRSSGVDPAAAALGGCLRFVRGEPPRIAPVRPARPLPFVIAVAGGGRSTAAAVQGLRARWEEDPARHERLFDAVGATVEAGIAAVEAGDLPGLGACLDRNQALLVTLGVSAPEVDALVAAARDAGALGAKLTGGGGGGAVLALAADPERVAAVLAARGTETRIARIGAPEPAAA